MKYIIFDFNGTILNDVDLGIYCINILIDKYLKRDKLSKFEYLRLFDFPIIDYYLKVGFDFKERSFEQIGLEWFELYNENAWMYHVYDGVVDVLKDNIDKGYKNIIISASKSDFLIKQCQELRIADYFDEIIGIDDIYAKGKIDIAKKWIADKNIEDCIFIGDTTHDKLVADAMMIPCILVANGHQAKDRLLKICDNVCDDVREVSKLI